MIKEEPTMKRITFLLIAFLAIGGSAYAQSNTSATAAAEGSYPAGTTFNGVPITGLTIGSGALLAADGTAQGHFGIELLGPTVLGVQQIISVEATASSGSSAAANVATISGTCSIDMGNGTPPLIGVPFVVTITTNAQSLGSVGLVLGATALPTATIGDGTMAITSLLD
jgi:hypothetical protein